MMSVAAVDLILSGHQDTSEGESGGRDGHLAKADEDVKPSHEFVVKVERSLLGLRRGFISTILGHVRSLSHRLLAGVVASNFNGNGLFAGHRYRFWNLLWP